MAGHNIDFLYLTKNGFVYYNLVSSRVIKLDFQPNIIQDLEIVNKQELINQIKTFLVLNKIAAAKLVLVLSPSILFEKDFVNITKDTEEEIQKFLNSVPFENVSSKKFATEKGFHVEATNTELITAIKNGFENCGFEILAAIPYLMAGKQVDDVKGLELSHLLELVKNTEEIKEQSLLQQETVRPEDEKENITKKPNITLLISIPIFVILIGILIFMVISQVSSNNKTLRSRQTLLYPTKIISPTIQILETSKSISTGSANTASEEAKIAENLKVQILSDMSRSSLVSDLKKRLGQINFKNIEASYSSTLNTEKTLAIFSQTVPIQLRLNLINELKKVLPNISTQENKEATLDVVIIIAK